MSVRLLMVVALVAGLARAAFADEPASVAPDEVSAGAEGEGATEPAAPDEALGGTREGRAAAVATAWIDATGPNGWLKREWQPYYALEGGYGRVDGRGVWSLRLLAGPMWLWEPAATAFPIIVDVNRDYGAAIGAGVDFLAMRPGAFLTLGALGDPDDGAILSASVGWQLLVVDLQQRLGAAGPTTDVLFKLRIPISWIVYGIREAPGRRAGDATE